MKKPLKQSAGVALVTVLLVVAAATIAAVSISVRQQVDIRRTESLLRSDQAWLHALGVESWAKGRLDELAKDIAKDPTLAPVRRNGEEWEIIMRDDGSVEGGDVVGKLIEQQGRFNLNNLVKDPNPNPNPNPNQKQNLISNPTGKQRFEKLLLILGINDADILADALTDWLDTDQVMTGIGGAEDDHYQSLEKPYRAANRLMAHPSELLLVEGFTLAIYRKLIGHVTALPASNIKININTASKEVLESVLTGMDSRGIDDIITTRDAVPYAALPTVAGVDYTGAGVESRYFSVVAGATVGKAKVALISLLGQTNVLQGVPGAPQVQGLPGNVIVLHRMREDVLELEDMY